jgi:hypothetical protein
VLRASLSSRRRWKLPDDVNFASANASAVGVTAPFQITVEADPAQAKTISAGGLAAGATVNSSNATAESNETNNVSSRTDPA